MFISPLAVVPSVFYIFDSRSQEDQYRTAQTKISPCFGSPIDEMLYTESRCLTYSSSAVQPYDLSSKPQPVTYPTLYPSRNHPARGPHTPLRPNTLAQFRMHALISASQLYKLVYAFRFKKQYRLEAHSPLTDVSAATLTTAFAESSASAQSNPDAWNVLVKISTCAALKKGVAINLHHDYLLSFQKSFTSSQPASVQK